MATAKKAAPAPVKSAVKPGTAVATQSAKATGVQPAGMMDLFAQHAGEGLERASMRDYALPFIHLLQKMSPQVDQAEDSYVKGAKAGMFINTVTGELFDEIVVIPADYHKVFNEWVPRDAGGGFVASHATAEDAAKNRRDDETQIVETANHYVLAQKEDGSFQAAILSLTSTKLKSSRNWNSQISQRTIDTPAGKKVAPSFACKYTLSSQSDKNEHGTFFITKITPVEGAEGWVSDPDVFQMAINFRAAIKSGIAKTVYEKTPGQDDDKDDTDDKY